MPSSHGEQANRLATAHLSRKDRHKIARLMRERAEEEVDEYTTLGELRALARDVVQSKAVRIRTAAPFEAKVSVAVHALAEHVRNEITQSL